MIEDVGLAYPFPIAELKALPLPRLFRLWKRALEHNAARGLASQLGTLS